MTEPKKRPLFLTVLCYITFMTAVTGLWTQSERLWSPGIVADTNREVFETVREKFESQAEGEQLTMMEAMFDAVISQTTAKNIQTGAIILIIFESISLYAAYLMWNFKKKGYYLYLGGIAVAFLGPILLIGSWMGIISAISGILMSVLMAVLYAFNLKHLTD
ncbi:hypothetical protein CLV98_102203 [Dyadobacter jejuensis]|uniref:Uncharacterized protein n=1 Tax=Dyadobacter jejuensis TaxID=1082580 RepID=A0A316ARB7_9BACT|nr:hypothetical protein [Dyadobacter jejuensis]PWJ59370.1 hypothetical protein CLV98_102203 [Dyadobacter jejuensis]